MSLAHEKLLRDLVQSIPYLGFLGIRVEMAGDELTAVLPYRPHLIGNPTLPAIHGGVTAAFLEVTAISGLLWSGLRQGSVAVDVPLVLPKTIDLTIDYLRPGLPRDAYARARINRSGRRYASVHIEAWQDDPNRLFAQATGHFLTRAE